MPYNTMYERLVDQGDNTVSGYIAYGLYKHAKREWVRDFEQANGRSPTAQEQAGYVASYTPQITSALQTQATGVLAQFAAGAVDDARPEILREALRGSAWKSVGLSIAANVIYTLLLVAVVLVLAYAGVDILGIVSNVRSSN